MHSAGATPYIVIESSARSVSVRLGGHSVAFSRAALRLSEGRYRAVLYLPRQDCGPRVLVPTKRRTHCPHKGEARYFDVKVKGLIARDAAWSYESPKAEVAAIAGFVAFYPHQVDIDEEGEGPE